MSNFKTIRLILCCPICRSEELKCLVKTRAWECQGDNCDNVFKLFRKDFYDYEGENNE